MASNTEQVFLNHQVTEVRLEPPLPALPPGQSDLQPSLRGTQTGSAQEETALCSPAVVSLVSLSVRHHLWPSDLSAIPSLTQVANSESQFLLDPGEGSLCGRRPLLGGQCPAALTETPWGSFPPCILFPLRSSHPPNGVLSPHPT